MRWCVIFLLFVYPLLSILAQSPFVCDGSLFITLDQQVYKMELDLENADFSFTPLPYTSGVNLNAMGYRVTDNFIYGIADHLFFYTLCRIDASGKATILDTLNISQTLTLPAGTITDDGKYLIIMDVWADSLEEVPNTLLLIDLESPDYDMTTFTVQNGSDIRNNVFSADLVFDPLQRNLIGFDFYKKQLFRLHLDDYSLEFENFIPAENVEGSIPALFFDPFSQLYGYERNDVFNELYFIETTNGQIQKISKNDDLRLAPYRDGCSCPYTVKMEKTVFPTITYPCTDVIYTIKIGNLNQKPQTNLLLEDHLPEGFIFKEIIHHSLAAEIEGIGTNQLHISSFDLERGTDSLVFKVSIPEDAAGMYFNQATLSGLDLSSANDVRTVLVSDYPLTEQIDDPTPLEVLIFPTGQFVTQLEFCPDTSLTIYATPAPGSVSIEWEDGSNAASRIIETDGVYRVTVTTDCEQNEHIFNIRETLVHIYLGPDQTVGLGDSIHVQPNTESSIPIAGYRWSWWNETELSCMDCPSISLTPTESGVLSLEAWTENGCAAQTEMYITVSRIIFAPNAFSPNADGINDTFRLFASNDLPILSFKVFDRWGNLVFEQKQTSIDTAGTGWNGMVRGNAASPGIYAWFAEIQFADGVVKQFTGDVALIR